MAAAGAAAMGTAPVEQLALADGPEHAEESTYIGTCRGNCGGACRMNVHVRDGKVVKTSAVQEENPLETRICQRGLSHSQFIYSPRRVQYPMRRVDGTPRGGGQWERITWDEAIGEIASKWRGYIDEYGPRSVATNFGTGTKGFNHYAMTRLMNVIGGTVFESRFDMAALDMGVDILGRSYYLSGNDVADSANSRYFFVWGLNMTSSMAARWSFIDYARKNNGAKIIVIDPHFTDIAGKADMWVPIKPGTDGVLAMAMTNAIIAEGLQDDEFLARRSVAPFLVKEDGTFLRMSDLGVTPGEGEPDPKVVMGADGAHGAVEEIADPVISGTFEIEGIKVTTAYDKLVERIAQWTPERASEFCDVPVETIYELARMYAEGPSNLALGFGNDHWGNGAAVTHCELTLAIVAGQLAKPGCSIGGNMGQSCVGTTGLNIGGAAYPTGSNLFMTSLQYLPEIVETGKYGDVDFPVKSIFAYMSNALVCHTDRNALLRALDKVELFVVSDTVLTDTAQYADIVLPVPHWFEYETFAATSVPYLDFNEKAIEPLYECKTDVEIASALGEALGFDNMTFTNEEFHRLFLDGYPLAESMGLSYDGLVEKKRIRMCPAPYVYGTEENPFKTASGRAEFYLENPVHKFRLDRQHAIGELDVDALRLPRWEPPIEAWEDNELTSKYPLTLITLRDKFKVHTIFGHSPWLTELQPEPTVSMNPLDAEARGLEEGQMVRVFNDRGSFAARMHLDPSFRPGTLKSEHGWSADQYVQGCISEVTSVATRHFKPNNSYFDTLVEVEPYTEGE